MNVQTLEQFKNIILQKRWEILSEGNLYSWIDQEKNNQPVDVQFCHYKSHLADQAKDSMQLEFYSYFKARQIKYLRQLEKALIRIKNGDYGICIGCGKKIPEERLKTVPHTRHCVSCKKSKKTITFSWRTTV